MVLLETKKAKISIVIAGGFFCAGFIVAVFWFLQNTNKAEWKDVEISHLALSGQNDDFSVEGGKIFESGQEISPFWQYSKYVRVEKLALFYQWMSQDPLLFDPNLDVQSFADSTERLKKIDEVFNQKTRFGYVHPIAFLENFFQTSLEFQNFSQNVSEENAQRLLNSVKKNSKAYADEVERFAKIFNEAEDNHARIAFLGGQTYSNLQIARADFEVMKKNEQELFQEVASREKCLNAGECKFETEFKKPTIGNVSTGENLDIFPVNKLETSDQAQGPFLIHSQCWKKRDEDLLLVAKRCFKQYGCMSWPFLSDDVLFVNIDEATRVGADLSSPEMKGMERGLQSISTPYGCTDQTYKSKIQTIEFALQDYASKKMFGDDFGQFKNVLENFEVIKNEGVKVENDFFAAQYPSDEAMGQLAQYYAYVYSELSKKNVDSQSREEFLQRALVLNGQMVGFDSTLNRLAFHFDNNLNNPRHKMGPNAWNSFLVWSNYSVTFLNFSPFVWKIGEKPTYLVKDKPAIGMVEMPKNKKTVYLDFQEASGIYGQDKVLDWIKAWNMAKISD